MKNNIEHACRFDKNNTCFNNNVINRIFSICSCGIRFRERGKCLRKVTIFHASANTFVVSKKERILWKIINVRFCFYLQNNMHG